MAVSGRAVTVATTATRLDTVADDADSVAGQSIVVYNAGDAVVYLGGSNVTTSSPLRRTRRPTARGWTR